MCTGRDGSNLQRQPTQNVTNPKHSEQGKTSKDGYHCILLAHAAFGGDTVCMDGDHRLPFQLIHGKTGLATEILAGICIVKLSCNHIFWMQDVPKQ